jgi:hypothetical protein
MRFLDHTQTNTHQDYSRPAIGPGQRPLPDNTKHSEERDVYAPGGIRTRNPSKRKAIYPRLRPRSHWDRPDDEWLT